MASAIGACAGIRRTKMRRVRPPNELHNHPRSQLIPGETAHVSLTPSGIGTDVWVYVEEIRL